MANRVLLVLLSVLLGGCMSAGQHQRSLPSAEEKKLTAGIVQMEIRKGMQQSDVAAVLGSPNLVTRDIDGRETWIYDKVSTDFAYSRNSGGVSALILGWGSSVVGAGVPSYRYSSGASSRTQRTLTIVLKFSDGVVDEYAYHTSSF